MMNETDVEMLRALVESLDQMAKTIDDLKHRENEAIERNAKMLEAFGVGYAYAWAAVVDVMIAQDPKNVERLRDSLEHKLQVARQKRDDPAVLKALQHCLELVPEKDARPN